MAGSLSNFPSDSSIVEEEASVAAVAGGFGRSENSTMCLLCAASRQLWMNLLAFLLQKRLVKS